jgi:hypothetical protein
VLNALPREAANLDFKNEAGVTGQALARRLAIIMHAMLRHGTEFRAA